MTTNTTPTTTYDAPPSGAPREAHQRADGEVLGLVGLREADRGCMTFKGKTIMSETVEIQRAFSGVRVDGRGLGVTLMPGAYGQISVGVTAFPTITPYDRACSLQNVEGVTDFAPSCIHIVGDTLQCLQHSKTLFAFREGFMLELEPGMKELIQDAYPKLVLVAEHSARVFLRVNALMKGRGIAHMADFIPNVLAAIVLDDQDVEQALASEVRMHFAGKDAAFMQSFEDSEVRAILDDAASAKQCSLTQSN